MTPAHRQPGLRGQHGGDAARLRGAAQPFNKLFRAFALRRTGLVNEIKNKLQYT
jgi:hypothetical protein